MAVFVAVLAAALLFLLTGKLYQRYWDRGLTAEIYWEKTELTQGEECRIQEVVENRKWLPLTILTIKFRLDKSIQYIHSDNSKITDYNYRNDSISLMPYQRVTRRFEVNFTRRGVFSIEDVALVTTDLFFLSSLQKQLSWSQSIYVFPDCSRIPQLQKPLSQLMGQVVSRRILLEDPFELRGIRPYGGSDPMNRMNWKASARSNDLLVNQFFETREVSMTVLLDVEQGAALFRQELLEEGIRMVRSYLEACTRQGIPVRVLSNGTVENEMLQIEAGASSDHYLNCLRKLAALDLSHPVCGMVKVLENLPQEETQCVVLISENQRPDLAQAFEDRVKWGQWMILTAPDRKREQEEDGKRIFYVEVRQK